MQYVIAKPATPFDKSETYLHGPNHEHMIMSYTENPSDAMVFNSYRAAQYYIEEWHETGYGYMLDCFPKPLKSN